MNEEIKDIIESLLFVADEPLSIERLRGVIGTAETARIREAIAALAEDYENRGGGFYLKEVAGGYQLRTRSEYNEWIKRLVQPKPPRLSKAALETLAIIAYKQPIIRSDIELIRGVDSGGILRLLLKRKLVRVLGRKEIPGRPLIYATSRRFLEVFDLKDLRDLPTPKEIEEFGTRGEEDLEGALEDFYDMAGYETDGEAAAPSDDGESASETPVDDPSEAIRNEGPIRSETISDVDGERASENREGTDEEGKNA
jgi:segregation and condensation protein B